ncbi:Crp/Fnr family transcriptional regulator [Methylocaldum sp.]|uniref:Crp/Fnr family transcriptional regulator n=1 Tax=Methylocaldum sp. TaxID=1969727 RepID=UPI002D388CED|nr:Crp/Fnr family transcriptional regulator [Methylocaldum sp.]HYE35340.1 Crp/Fnr family transcriptional regulator [Methylocaldum sp.]
MSNLGNGSVSVARPPAARRFQEDTGDVSAGLEMAGLEAALRGGKQKSFAAKQIIFREGDPADTVLTIRQGLVKLISYSPDGRSRIVRLHAKYAFLGLGGLIEPTYRHTAVAVDHVEVICTPLRAVAQIKKDNPYLYCRLIECWYQHLKSADIWITDFSTGSIRARVARLVNFLADIQNDASASTAVTLLTCEEMAAILGVTVESVSRVLAEFKRTHMLRAVKCKPAKRYETNAPALRRVAQV